MRFGARRQRGSEYSGTGCTQARRERMAYAIVHHFPGGTREQYEASIAAVHPSDGSLPEGQIFHAAGPSAGGWTVMAGHYSPERWGRLPAHRLMSPLRAGGG